MRLLSLHKRDVWRLRLRRFRRLRPIWRPQARRELYAARNDYAATLYQKLVDQEPTQGACLSTDWFARY